MERIKFTKKSKDRVITNNCDFKLYVNKSGKDKDGNQRYSFVGATYNNSHIKLTTTEYVGISVTEDHERMYFETAVKTDGFKLSRNSTSPESTRFFKFGVEYDPELEKYVGKYNLEFDEKEKLYFISLTESAAKDGADKE